MMVKAILLDCGGVMVAPPSGDWMLAPEHEAILGEDFAARHLDAFRRERRAFLHLLPDTRRIDTDEEEYVLVVEYLRHSLAAIGISLQEEALRRLAWLQVYRDDRYILFDDVIPMLKRWQGRYKLGIVSDAPPSTRRILDDMGVLGLIEGITFSCDVGALKPDPSIYRNTLSLLSILPQEAVFVDDIPSKLRGAQALGIRGVQMRRPMPPLFDEAPPWNGPIVHSLVELDTLLEHL